MAVRTSLASLLVASSSMNILKKKQKKKEIMTKVVGTYYCKEDEKLTKEQFSSFTKADVIIEGVRLLVLENCWEEF
jgi:membrane-bound inhibitor of C-type lysozyme